MKSISKSFAYGEHQVSIETGEVARQADGAVLVTMHDTVVLVTVVARKDADPNRPFFPLTVNYQERPTAPAASRADSSSVKVVPARRRPLPRA